MLDRLRVTGHLPIGVEIHATGAHVVQLARGRRGPAIVAAARVDMPSAIDAPDTRRRLCDIAAAVGNAVRAHPFRSRVCVLAPDDRLVRTRSIRQPSMTEDERALVIAAQGPERLGFGPGDACEIDGLLAGEVRQGDETREEVIIAGIRRSVAEDAVAAFGDAGLRTSAIEPGFVGVARAAGRTFRRESDRASVRVVVHVAWTATTVLLLRGPQLAFHKRLELSGESMTQEISRRLSLEPVAVADLRHRRMQRADGGAPDVDEKVDRALHQAIRPLVNQLAHEVNLCLRYYSVTFRGARPEQCFVVGSEAGEPGLAETIGTTLNMPSLVGDPARGMTRMPGASAMSATGPDPEWAGAIGLALRGYRERAGSGRPIRTAEVEEPEVALA